jgi:hypothetical protein
MLFLGSLFPWSTLRGQGIHSRSETDPQRLEHARERMRQAREEEAKAVERLYSVRPIRFALGKHTYEIPANYFGPKDLRDWPTGSKVERFGFDLFRPDYGGYTKENWRDPFDRRKITVVSLNEVNKYAIGRFTDGTRRPLSPDRFDALVRFERIRSSLETQSSELHGLTVYSYKAFRDGSVRPGAVWAGHRSNSEFFWFRTSLAPGQPKRNGYPPNPQCDVRYYSEQEDLEIVYRYSQVHVADWREIDDAVWTKIRQWRVS